MRHRNDPSINEYVEQAALWVARLQSKDATEEDRAAFELWLENDPKNGLAYEEMQDLWGDLKHIPMQKADFERMRRSRRLRSAGVASVVIAGIAIVGLYRAGYYDRWQSDYYTIAGEIRAIRLEDGTQVDLNTDTAIEVAYTADKRTIRLLRGEAFFNVAKNPQRPFVVDDGQLNARAVGTRYTVRKASGALSGEVQVEEGSVEVETASDHALLSPGQVATVIEKDKIEITRDDVESKTAWKDGKLIFSERPLRDVLATLSRYRNGRIVLLDHTIGDQKVSGIFDIKNTDDALNALQTSLPVNMTRVTDFLVFVSAR